MDAGTVFSFFFILVSVTILGVKFMQLKWGAKKHLVSAADPLEVAQLRMKNKALEERVENLEMIICRLDQKINTNLKRTTLEKSHEEYIR